MFDLNHYNHTRNSDIEPLDSYHARNSDIEPLDDYHVRDKHFIPPLPTIEFEQNQLTIDGLKYAKNEYINTISQMFDHKINLFIDAHDFIKKEKEKEKKVNHKKRNKKKHSIKHLKVIEKISPPEEMIYGPLFRNIYNRALNDLDQNYIKIE